MRRLTRLCAARGNIVSGLDREPGPVPDTAAELTTSKKGLLLASDANSGPTRQCGRSASKTEFRPTTNRRGGGQNRETGSCPAA